MRIFRFALHMWITLASVLSFLMGWVALAHAPKPVQYIQTPAASSQVVQTLVPLPDLQFGGDQSSNTFQNFQNFQAPSSAPAPIFRTGGS
jgi:hypothetical protein